MTEPLPVSVILPTHNRVGVLARAIRSVLAQTRPPAEVIVVDDASQEDVAGAIARLDDTRVRLLRLERNMGAGVARNRGVEIATQDWIAFQDSDDEWLIEKLALQWRAADMGKTDAALICGTYLVLPRQGRPWMEAPAKHMQQRLWSPAARFSFPFIAPTWLLRKQIFLECGGFDATLPNLEDWELSFRLHDRGGFVALSEPLVAKHGSADGLNRIAARQAESLRLISEKHCALLDADPAIRANFERRRARYGAAIGDRAGTRHALRAAYKAQPDWRSGFLFMSAFLGLWALRIAQSLLGVANRISQFLRRLSGR